MKCRWKRGCLASQCVDRRGLVGGEVVADQVHVQVGGNGLVDGDQELLELHRPVPAVQLGDHRAVGDVERREQAGDAVAGVIVGAPLGHAGHHRQHRLGPVQRLHLALLVHAQHHRLLRRIVVEANDIDDFGHELRVGGELEPVDEMRFEIEAAPDPARSSRATARPAWPSRSATSAWRSPASPPASPTTTSSTLSNRIEGGRPGRGSSSNPSRRWSTNRPRHLATVCAITRKSAATCLFVAPGSAQAKTIRARNANACADFARRDHRCSWSRSARRQHQISLRPPRPWAVEQAVHTVDFKSLAPLVNRCHRHTQIGRHLCRHRRRLRQRQHNPGPHRTPRRLAPRQAHQSLALPIGQFELAST